MKENDRYYLFGEYKTNDENKFIGFSCYSSSSLTDWRYEGLALTPQKDGLLGPSRIGERVKVLKHPKSQRFIMLMHTDDLAYNDPVIGIAVSDRIDGEFTFKGHLLFQGEKLRKWDMGTFVDADGTAYILFHEGDIYQLSDDYLSVEKKIVTNIASGGESPAMFKSNDTYFLLFSNKTSWERNDNYYLTATSINGPWTYQGLFCPEGTLTYNSQCSFVFEYEAPNGKKTPIYMGDRWSFPRQESSATQVWLPIEVNDGQMAIANYMEMWDIDSFSEVEIQAEHPLNFGSNGKGKSVAIDFRGKQVLVYGNSSKHGGYAEFKLYNYSGKMIHSSVIDFYSLVENRGLRYISPEIEFSEYYLEITVMGTNGIWFKKSGEQFGSDDYFVEVTAYHVITE